MTQHCPQFAYLFVPRSGALTEGSLMTLYIMSLLQYMKCGIYEANESFGRSSKSFQQNKSQPTEPWLIASSICPAPVPVCFYCFKLETYVFFTKLVFFKSLYPENHYCFLQDFRGLHCSPLIGSHPQYHDMYYMWHRVTHVSSTPVYILLLTRIIKLLLLQIFMLDSHTEGDLQTEIACQVQTRLGGNSCRPLTPVVPLG